MAADAFLVLTPDGAPLTGESTDSAFNQKPIEITEFDTGEGASVSDEDLPTKEAGPRWGQSYSPFGFTISKNVDAASPALFHAYCTTFSGRFMAGFNRFTKAVVSFRKAGGGGGAYRTRTGAVYLKMVFEQVILTGYDLTADGDGSATEKVTFAFQSCQLQYQAQTPTGGVAPAEELKGWDYAKNVVK